MSGERKMTYQEIQVAGYEANAARNTASVAIWLFGELSGAVNLVAMDWKWGLAAMATSTILILATIKDIEITGKEILLEK